MPGYHVIVIGAGASGLMAAGKAAEVGARTLLLEKMPRPGLKLGIAGKGRGNLTNLAPFPDFMEHFASNGRFLRQAFSSLSPPQLIDFLEKRGVRTVAESGGRIFPSSGKAQEVVEALADWIKESGVALVTHSGAEELLLEKGSVGGVRVSRERAYVARCVILAAGGSSYPQTGSSGDGYLLAESVGHTIVPIRPALVPLVTAGEIAPRLQGVSLRGVRVKVLADSRKLASAWGEMLFTHFGVSGPLILSLSRKVVDSLISKKSVTLSIDLMPDVDEHELDARLLAIIAGRGKCRLTTVLKEFLPRKLVPICTESADVDPNTMAHQMKAEERKRLRVWLKDFRLEVKGHLPLKDAIVTAGGVDTREIDPHTMASRLVPNLYFSGEIIDVDADTGGYNLQAAFSTGWLAGLCAARRALTSRT